MQAFIFAISLLYLLLSLHCLFFYLCPPIPACSFLCFKVADHSASIFHHCWSLSIVWSRSIDDLFWLMMQTLSYRFFFSCILPLDPRKRIFLPINWWNPSFLMMMIWTAAPFLSSLEPPLRPALRPRAITVPICFSRPFPLCYHTWKSMPRISPAIFNSYSMWALISSVSMCWSGWKSLS